MEWLVSSVERELGIARQQLAPAEGRQLVALVPAWWVASLRRNGAGPCPRPEGVAEAELPILMQRSISRLPPGWTRVSIQGLRKSRIASWFPQDLGAPDPNLDSLCGFMSHVAEQNYRNLWQAAQLPKQAQPEASPASCLQALKGSLSRVLGCSFIQLGQATLSPLENGPLLACGPAHPNLLPAEALLESAEALYLVQSLPCFTLQDAVTFSPAKLANSHAKLLFVLYQALQAMRTCHQEGLACGALTLAHLSLDDRLFTRLRINLCDYEAEEGGGGHEELEPSLDPQSLSELVTAWVSGRVSNYTYLMGLNRLAGRRSGDPNYHPVLPWVVDFTAPHGRFRDLRKSKFRLNKGDKQLDFTYQMTREAFAGGAPGAERLHVPHHLSDVLSDITYYVYRARRTPRSRLCKHVRSQWEPNEYPASVERVQSWTPEECIPEFYTDPSIFQSIHPDMADLEVPAWCGSPHDFVAAHRRLLESREVSLSLHHWVDLTFGYQLSGKEAVRAKNVCLLLVDGHTHLTSYGVVQLFDQPHPHRQVEPSWASSQPPPIARRPQQPPGPWREQGRVNGVAAEEGQEPVEGGGDLEEGTEALDSLSAVGAPLDEAPAPSEPLLGRASRAWGLGEREEGPVILPEGFKPLQALEELERLGSFLSRGLQTVLPEPGAWKGPVLPHFSCLLQRDMQAFGVLVAEVFFSQKLRLLGPDAPLQARWRAVRRLALPRLREVAGPLQQAIVTLLQLQVEHPVGLAQEWDPSLFQYPPVQEGLPPPSPSLLLSPCCPIIPFPAYFGRLHRLACSFWASVEGLAPGRELVFALWQQLDRLLEEVEPEGLDILLPFILELLADEATAVYSAWYLFEPIARALGPAAAQRCLLAPLVGVYEMPGSLAGRFYLYTDCFVLQLMVRLGLQAFLTSLLPHILLVLTGQAGSAEVQGLGVGLEDEGAEGKSGVEVGSLEGSGPEQAEGLQGGMFPNEPEAGEISSNSEASGEEQDSNSKVELSLASPSGQDLEPVQGCRSSEEEEEEEEEEKRVEVQTEVLAASCCSPEDVTVRESEEEQDEELSEDKEQKILLDTACKTVKWLTAKLGPTLSSRHIVRNLLRLLVTCYFGVDKQQSVSGEEDVLCVGSVYKHRPVLGDLLARPLLDCLIYVAHLYGEPLLTYQCLPYITYLVAPGHSRRLNSRKEASLLAAVVLMQKVIVHLSDTTLMDILPKVTQDLLLPVLEVLTSPLASFPGGAQGRSVLGMKTLSLIALLCLRIGQEMVVLHMSETLQRFFEGFSIVPEQWEKMGLGEGSGWWGTAVADGWDPAAVEELWEVFNMEMAFSAYIPFNCLIGDATIKQLLMNHELVWTMAARYQESVSGQASQPPLPPSPTLSTPTPSQPPPGVTGTGLGPEDGGSSTFGSPMVGNRIGMVPGTERSASGPGVTQPTGIPVAGAPEPGSLKQELARSSRRLDGNWLAHWRYQVGRGLPDGHFHFHQIRLQSYTGHTGTVRTITPLPAEDFFLSASRDKTVKLWPLYNHGDGSGSVEPRLTYAQHRRAVFSAQPLGTLQQVASCDGNVHLWDPYTGSTVRVFDGFDSRTPVTALVALPAPHCSLLAGTSDSVLHFMDPRKPGLQHAFRLGVGASAGLIRSMAVSPSGRSVAVGFSSGFIYLLDTRTGLILKVWPAHESDILQLKSVEGNVLVSSSTDHSLSIWKESDPQPLHHYKSLPDPVHAFDLHGSEIVAGTVANRIGIYSLDGSAAVATSKLSWENFRGVLTSLGVLPTKGLLLLGSDNGMIRLLA